MSSLTNSAVDDNVRFLDLNQAVAEFVHGNVECSWYATVGVFGWCANVDDLSARLDRSSEFVPLEGRSGAGENVIANIPGNVYRVLS